MLDKYNDILPYEMNSPANSLAEAIITIHAYIWMYLTLIGVGVVAALASILWDFYIQVYYPKKIRRYYVQTTILL